MLNFYKRGLVGLTDRGSTLLPVPPAYMYLAPNLELY